MLKFRDLIEGKVNRNSLSQRNNSHKNLKLVSVVFGVPGEI